MNKTMSLLVGLLLAGMPKIAVARSIHSYIIPNYHGTDTYYDKSFLLMHYDQVMTVGLVVVAILAVVYVSLEVYRMCKNSEKSVQEL